MFSARFGWSLEQNALTRLLAEKRARGEDVLDLTESNPTRAGFEYPREEILAALADPRALLYDPAPAGLAQAREAVAGEHYNGRVPPDRILLTAGTSEAYSYVFKLLADPGDAVLVPRPSYPLFEFLAAMESVQAIQYPLAYHDRWQIDFDRLRGLVTPRTRALVLVNPNNPTGSFLKARELELLLAWCADRKLAIVSDEVFSGYAFDDDPDRVASLIDAAGVLTFCLGGLSKAAGLPQLKLAWIVTRGEACQRLEFIADAYLSVAAPVQWAAGRLLQAGRGIREQIRRRTRANLDFLRAAAGPASLWRVLHVEGGWYAILQAPRICSEEEWALRLLSARGVLVQPGFFFDFEREAFLVVSLLPPPETFQRGVAQILTAS